MTCLSGESSTPQSSLVQCFRGFHVGVVTFSSSSHFLGCCIKILFKHQSLFQCQSLYWVPKSSLLSKVCFSLIGNTTPQSSIFLHRPGVGRQSLIHWAPKSVIFSKCSQSLLLKIHNSGCSSFIGPTLGTKVCHQY